MNIFNGPSPLITKESETLGALVFNKALLKYAVFAFAITLTVLLSACGSDDSLELGGTTLTGVEATGETLYVSKLCNACHGTDATGGIGPNIQGSLPDMITVTAGAGSMASVSLTGQEAADISAFLTETDFTGYTPPDDGDGGDGGGDGASGETLYTSSCTGCHGADGTGGGMDITSSTAADIESASGVGTMAGVSVTSEEATALATYIASLSGGVDGGSLYTSGCAGCHGASATGGLGPDITATTASAIEAASGAGTMAGVSVTTEEATALATYIASL